MNKLPFRTGMGFDVHAFAENRKLVLGGVCIPYEKGLEGHSDADCLVHAINDALLGALAMGDIGEHFPDRDPHYKDICSLRMMEDVLALVHEAGYVVGNVDSVIMAQKPKMAPYIQAMRETIAKTLACETEQISIKATTTEHLGYVGREEGIACLANVLLVRSEE